MKNNRTCIISREESPKDSLIRIVKTKDNNFLVNSDAQGRGAYVSKKADANIIIKNKLLHRAFKTNVPNEVYEKLTSLLKGE